MTLVKLLLLTVTSTKSLLTLIPGYAVHVIKGTEKSTMEGAAKDPGRFWYTMGRDGKLTKIDLWQTPDKMRVAEVQVAYDARDVAVSGDGKYIVGGGYWPPHFVIVDAETMEPEESCFFPWCERKTATMLKSLALLRFMLYLTPMMFWFP